VLKFYVVFVQRVVSMATCIRRVHPGVSVCVCVCVRVCVCVCVWHRRDSFVGGSLSLKINSEVVSEF